MGSIAPMHASTAGVRALAIAVPAAIMAGLMAAPPAQADEWRDAQWYLDAFDIEAIHDITTGAGTTIGLIDTGTDVTHPDLVGADIVAGTGYGTIDDPFQDPTDHGTSMAALMVGQGHGDDDGVLGLAPDARLVVSSVNWDDDSRADVEHWQAQAVQEMVRLGVDVIVTSVGGGSGAQHQMKAAIESAKQAGIPFVAAAGNNEIVVLPGCDGQDCWEDAPTADETVTYDGLGFPAAYADAIPVFAHGADGEQWEKSPTVRGVRLAISAPGHELVATGAGGGYSIRSGTSGAAPLVAATFALVRSVHPEAEWDQLVDLVLGSARDAGEPGFDDEFGWGQIDPLAAVTEPLPASVEATPGWQEPTADEEFEGDAERVPLWLQNTISTAVLVALAAVIILPIVLLRRRRKRRRQAERVM